MAMSNSDTNHDVQSLWKYSKIVSMSSDGTLNFNKDHLNELLKSVDVEKQNLPINLIAIIGTRGSGKSFYSNLLIQYLKNDGKSSCISRLMATKGTESDIVKGFKYGNISNSENLVPDDDSSGIYMYPEPLFDKSGGHENETIVWVLHLHHPKSEFTVGNIYPLEALLNLACSTLTEIIWNTNNLKLLETRQLFGEGEHLIPEREFCQHIVFLQRTQKEKSTIIDNRDDAINQLRKIQHNLEKSFLESIVNVTVANIWDSIQRENIALSGSLHDEFGKLTINSDTYKKLPKILGAIAAENEFVKKEVNGEHLLPAMMGDYLASCVYKINTKYAALKDDICQSEKEGSTQVQHDETFPNSKDDTKLNSVPDNEKCSNSQLDQNEESIDQLESEFSKLSVTVAIGEIEQTKDDKSSNSNKRVALEHQQLPKIVWPQLDAKFKSEPAGASRDSTISSEAADSGKGTKCEGEINSKDKSADDHIVEAEQEKKQCAILKQPAEAIQDDVAKNALEALDIDEAVNIARKKLPNIMVEKLNDWINAELHISTIDGGKKIYEESINELINEEQKAGQIPVDSIPHFKNELTTKSSCLELCYSKIHEGIEKFHLILTRAFNESVWFSDDKFEEIASFTLQNILEGLGDQSQPYVKKACKCLTNMYLEQNHEIVKSETETADKCHALLLDKYKQVTASILKKGPYFPDELLNMHTKLEEAYRESFKLSLTFPLSKGNVSILETLQPNLQSGLAYFKSQNRKTLKENHQLLSRIITHCSRRYDDALDKKLRSNPKGIAEKDLNDFHVKATEDAKRSLENELNNSKLEQRHSIKVHLGVLQSNIDEAWPSFKEDNDDRVKANMGNCNQDEVEFRRRAELERLKTEQGQQSKAAITSPKHQSRPFREILVTPPAAPASATSQVHQNSAKNEGHKLPQLIFQITLDKVLMGVVTSSQAGLELSHIHHVPTLVGLTNTGEWVFGRNAENILSSNRESGFKSIWRVGDYLMKIGQWTQEINIFGKEIPITPEFLLGFILYSLKGQIENSFNGTVPDAFIIVPFWFGSSQRKGIKDAGKVAGFNNVYLLNENSAVAYKHARDRYLYPYINYIVLSENSDQIDVTLYSYYKNAGREMRMLGHRTVPLDNQSPQHDVNLIGEIVFDTWKHVAISANFDKSKPTEGIISYHSTMWRSILTNVGHRIGFNFVDVSESHLGLHCALSFCRNPASKNGVIKEMISHDVLLVYNSGEVKVAITKEYLHCLAKNTNFRVKNNVKEASFYQRGSFEHVWIGTLIMMNVPSSFQIQCGFNVDYDGIVSLNSACIAKQGTLEMLKGFVGFDSGIKVASSNDYQWLTPNITEQQCGAFSSIVQQLFKFQAENAEKSKAAQEVAKTAQNLLQGIKNGQANFRSELGRNMIRDQINDILKSVNQQNLAAIEKQKQTLDNFSQKYFPT